MCDLRADESERPPNGRFSHASLEIPIPDGVETNDEFDVDVGNLFDDHSEITCSLKMSGGTE